MLLSATKSHRKNQIELVQNVLHAEEEKRRRERELFHITAVPLLSRASQEPGLFVLGGVAGDDHVERKSIPGIARMLLLAELWRIATTEVRVPNGRNISNPDPF